MPVPNLGGKHAVARMFASAVPGLAGLLAGELEAIEGIRALETGFDGRSRARMPSMASSSPASRPASPGTADANMRAVACFAPEFGAGMLPSSPVT